MRKRLLATNAVVASDLGLLFRSHLASTLQSRPHCAGSCGGQDISRVLESRAGMGELPRLQARVRSTHPDDHSGASLLGGSVRPLVNQPLQLVLEMPFEVLRAFIGREEVPKCY